MRFEEIGESDGERLADWIPKYTWPYHARSRVDSAWVRSRIAAGNFFGINARSFWAMAPGDTRDHDRAALAIVAVNAFALATIAEGRGRFRPRGFSDAT